MAKAVCGVDGNRVSARGPVDPGFEVRWSCLRIVSVAEVDERRVARERAGVKSARKRPRSSCLLLHGSGAAKERRKPGPGRRSPGTGGGSAFEVGGRESGSRPSGHSSVEGVSDRAAAKAFDEASEAAVLGRALRSSRSGARCDRRRQRSMRTPRPRKKTPRHEGPNPRALPIGSPPGSDAARARPSSDEGETVCAHRSKLVGRRQARHDPDAHARRKPRGGRVGAKASPPRKSSGRRRCTCRRSVAEVGEEHLPRPPVEVVERRPRTSGVA